MLRKVLLIGIIFALFPGMIFPNDSERKESYLKAVNEKDQEQKIVLLKEYIQTYGNVQDEFLSYVYIHLTEASFNLKKFDDVLIYGEKALQAVDIAEGNKIRVIYFMAHSYYNSKSNLEKAISYARVMIDLANAIIEKTKNANLDEEKRNQIIQNQEKFYIVGGYRLLTMAYYEMAKTNPEALNNAMTHALELHNLDQSPNSVNLVLVLSHELFKQNKLKEAIAATESVIKPENLDEKTASFLATMYYKDGDKNKAAFYYEKVYQTQKKADLAMNIGKLVYKVDIDKGIQYFADAYVMSKQDKTSAAYKYLQELYYNRKARGMSPAEQEKGFQMIVRESRLRLGDASGDE